MVSEASGRGELLMSVENLMILRKVGVHPGRCWQGGDRRALWGQVGEDQNGKEK